MIFQNPASHYKGLSEVSDVSDVNDRQRLAQIIMCRSLYDACIIIV